MSRYAPSLVDDPRVESRRSTPLTVIAVAVAVIAAFALWYSIANFASIAAGARELADQAVTARNEFSQRVAPFAYILASAIAIPVAIWAAIWRSRVLVNKESGNRLRRKVDLAFAGDWNLLLELHRRFATGDPKVYTPVPANSGRGGAVGLEAWLVPEDRIAYVGLSYGFKKDVQRAGVIRYTDRAYDAFAAAVRHELHRPLPDDKNPNLAAPSASA